MNNYKNLLSPITIKHMTVRNRVAMPPMGTNYGGAMGDFTDEHITYYEKRAEYYLLHEDTRKQLEFLLNKLAKDGEKETLKFIKKEVLKENFFEKF